MPEAQSPAPIWRSPVAHLVDAAPRGPEVSLEDAARGGRVVICGDPRGDGFAQRVAAATGVALPLEPNTMASSEPASGEASGEPRFLLWTGPGEWLLTCPGGRVASIAAALGEAGIVYVPVSDGRACLRLSGVRAADVLRKGTSLDVHPRVLAPGRCAQTRLARVGVLIARPHEATRYDIYIDRGYAEYLWRWLVDAAREYTAPT